MVHWPQWFWMSIWCQSPLGRGTPAATSLWTFPNVEKPIQMLQITTASMGNPSWRQDTVCSAWWVGQPVAKQTGAPDPGGRSSWKSPTGQSWGSRRWHQLLGTFVAVSSSMAPKSAHLLCTPNTPDTPCAGQSAVSVGGTGLFCCFYELIYDLFTCMLHPHC